VTVESEQAKIRVGPQVVVCHADDQVVVAAPDGTMDPARSQGYFVGDTRMVSRHEVRLSNSRPVLLDGAAVSAYSARHEMTNPRLSTPGGTVPEHSLHLRLERLVAGALLESYTLTNHGAADVELDLGIVWASDFTDIFDVKAGAPLTRGRREDHRRGHGIEATYRSDGFRRSLLVEPLPGDPRPQVAGGELVFRIRLSPGESWSSHLRWQPGGSAEEYDRSSDLESLRLDAARRSRAAWYDASTRFRLSDPTMESVVATAVHDLAHLRLTRHDTAASGPGADPPGSDAAAWVPAAGIPWFTTLFGRDVLVVGFQTLCLAPRLALGTLRAHASLQGDRYDDDHDEQPGKIEHEVRHGELAERGLAPQTPYYGTSDATSLFVLLAARSFDWNGDRDALDSLRPHVERALAWIERDGDLDGDGLQEYESRSGRGMRNQGWKDSGHGIVDPEGNDAELPVATCELQGYVVAAYRAWASVLERAYHDTAGAGRLRDAADRLADLVEDRFWWEDEGTYYLALDGDKRPVESVTSNPAHLLWAGAVARERAERTVERLMADDMWSGWGIRTLSSRHRAYNPFSYQRGSVWPHDNALAAAGFRRYGRPGEAATVARGIFDAARRFQSDRLPEVFAGLERDEESFPVQYLGANIPQAWASGATVHLLATLLGLDARADEHVLFVDPSLPEGLTEVTLENLHVGTAVADLHVRCSEGRPSVELEVRSGTLDIETDLAPTPRSP